MLLKSKKHSDYKMNAIQSVCVYSASSTKIADCYFQAARELGELLGHHGIRLVNGAGNLGLMRACADACLNAQPLPNSQLGQNLAKPGWNCHHDNFKDSNPNIEWKATLEQAEKIGMGTRQYTLKKI